MTETEQTSTERWRLFFALWPDPAARAEAALLAEGISGRRVTPDNMHITLLFLGDVDPSRLPELERSVDRLQLESFEVALDRREITRRGIAWLAMTRLPESLQRLYRRLSEAMVEIGFEPEERPFRPHLTLARRARPQRPQTIAPIRWRQHSLALVRSRPEEGGVRYVTLREWPLEPLE